MKYITLSIIFMFQSLFAANILTHNIYESSDRVDMMLSFDSPYKGAISKRKENNTVILILDDALIKNIMEENINSNVINTIKIIPYRDSTYVEISSDKNFDVVASKTVDGFGLRIRAQSSTALTNQNETASEANEKLLLRTNQKTIDTGYKYTIVILILTFLILLLYFFKNRFLNSIGNKESWLFKQTKGDKKENIKITHKKMIDAKNKLSLIEFKDKKYLVIIGANGHLLLDKFNEIDIPDDDDNNDFDNIFSQNKQKLDEFIKQNNKKLDSYKAKASQDKFFSL